MLATGAALLVAAQFAGAAPERKGGIFKVGTIGRVGADRPAALVRHDRLVARVRDRGEALQLPQRPGGKLVARGRLGVQGLAGRHAVHVLHPQGFPVQRRRARHRRELQVRHRPRRESRPGVAGRSVHHRPRRASTSSAPSTSTTASRTSAASAQGEQADHQLDRPTASSSRSWRCRSSRRRRRSCRSTARSST